MALQTLYELRWGKATSRMPLRSFKYREMFVYFLSWFCLRRSGCLGYYVMTILINIAFTILYVLSPLLILAYTLRKNGVYHQQSLQGNFQCLHVENPLVHYGFFTGGIFHHAPQTWRMGRVFYGGAYQFR